ncbi:hypothetical protein Tco_1173013 [Tanacetum coccineum]
MFNKAFKRVNTFVDFRTDLAEEIAEVDDVQETAEVDDDQEAAKIKELMEIVPHKEEVAIDDIPLAVKPPSIVDWKIHKEGKKTYYQIIRADGSLKMYLVFSHMLKNFDREDLETLWKLEIDDPDITMEEYIRFKTEKALRKGKVYNSKTATYGQIRYDEDVYFLRSVETEFPAIVYNDVLTSELELSCEPMIFNIDDLKMDMGNGDDKINFKQPSEDLSIEPLPNVINTDVGSYAQESIKILETSHDTSSKFFKTETFIKELCVNIVTWNYFDEMMLINLIKTLSQYGVSRFMNTAYRLLAQEPFGQLTSFGGMLIF